MDAWIAKQVAEAFEAAREDGDADVMTIDEQTALIVLDAATLWANAHAKRHKELGNGEDVRAVFALAFGAAVGVAVTSSIFEKSLDDAISD